VHQIALFLFVLVGFVAGRAHASTLAAVEIEELVRDSDVIVRVHVTEACAHCNRGRLDGGRLVRLRVTRAYKGELRTGDMFELAKIPDAISHYVWGPVLKSADQGILFLRLGDEGYYALYGYRAFQKIAGLHIETRNFVDYPAIYGLARFERRLRTAVKNNLAGSNARQPGQN